MSAHKNKPTGAWGGAQRATKGVGLGLELAGVLLGETDLSEIGEAVGQISDATPEVRRKVREHLPGAVSRAGEGLTNLVLDLLDQEGEEE